jgi:hypothetical protein
MNTQRNLIAAVVLALGGACALAGTATPGVDKRQANQEQRIDQGVASGELNQREAHRLQQQQAALRKAERKAKADGTVTHAERKRLHRAQNEVSGNIAQQKHDGQKAGGGKP